MRARRIRLRVSHADAHEFEPDNVVRMCRCRNLECLAMFFVCLRCFSGQSYCSSACREKNRQEQLRAARARYQSSARGRELHRRRQRRYRLGRQACRVTDHPTARPAIATSRLALRSTPHRHELKPYERKVRPADHGTKPVTRDLITICVLCGSRAKWVKQDSW